VADRAGGSAGRSTTARIAALGALLAAIALVLILFLGNGDSYQYRLQFQTGGQLVDGNQVQVGGHPIGSIDSIELTDDWQADITISVDQQLHEAPTTRRRSRTDR
jgi:ABC-type transporter Mla subunit MlaD